MTKSIVAVPHRPDAAAAGRLVVVMAGPADAKARAKPYLEAHGRIIELGEELAQVMCKPALKGEEECTVV